MKNEQLAGNIMIAVGVVILAPIVIGGIVTLGSYAYAGVANTVNKIAFNRKIKKGLKEGSIIEQDGKYYEV